MLHHSHRITVRCTPAALFAVLLDPSANRRWQTGVFQTRWTPGEISVGTTITEIRELAGCSVTIVYQLIELRWPCRTVVRLLEGPLRGTASYVCDPVPRGTALTVSFAVRPVGRWRLAAPAVSSVIAAEVRLSCQRLTAVAEGAGAHGTPRDAGRFPDPWITGPVDVWRPDSRAGKEAANNEPPAELQHSA